MIKPAFKKAIRQLVRLAGFDLIHHSRDPVIGELLENHSILRLAPADLIHWCHLPPKVAAAAALRRLLRIHSIDLVIDVGANVGQYGTNLRTLGYRGRIISFEPGQEARARLLEAAAGDDLWTVRSEALGDTSGFATLHVCRNHVFSSLHPVSATGQEAFGEEVAEIHQEKVPVITLDELWPELTGGQSYQVLLKTDTQGHDASVLAGARATLERVLALQAEGAVLPAYEGAANYFDILHLATHAGLLLAGLFPLANRVSDQALIEVDCLFTRPSAA